MLSQLAFSKQNNKINKIESVGGFSPLPLNPVHINHAKEEEAFRTWPWPRVYRADNDSPELSISKLRLFLGKSWFTAQ